jgi:cytochrome P450
VNGALWKKWRSIFNPGFATAHLMSLVPGIVDDGLVYADVLDEHAGSGKVFRLEEATTRLTIDVIGKVVLDVRFNMQRGDNACVQAMREQVHLLPNEGSLNLWKQYSPSTMYRRWRNDRIMTQYIFKVLEERFAAKSGVSTKRSERSRTIMDLALDSYLAGEGQDDNKTAGGDVEPQLDDAFKLGACTQIRVFLFAGHDTTSSTICYALYMLRKHPECLQRIREEHQNVLGTLAETPTAIKNDPYILNKLEYTTAVIKETLRLWPAASAPRMGEKNLFIRDPATGESYPTEGLMVWLVHYGTHRNPAVWSAPNDFQPTRFLPENSYKIPEGAFRAFEMGARNCIGQNLAMIEARIILALVCRRFNFDTAFDSLHEVAGDGSFWAKDTSFRGGKQDVDGEEMYQVLVGAAKPREGMPARVTAAGWEKSRAGNAAG